MMTTLFSSQAPVFVQGMTGREGLRMAQWMMASGVRIVAGVTPGKGGQTVEGCPIFNSVQEAKRAFSDVSVTSIVVPAPRVLGAVQEAIEAGMTFLHILSEHVPVHDAMYIRARAKERNITILGPSSVGYLQFPTFRVGYLGGEQPFHHLQEGSLGIVSASGGMANEIIQSLARQGVGIRTALATGGDRIVGMTISEAVAWMETMSEVKQIGVFTEMGNPFLMAKTVAQKPTVVYVSGSSLEVLPRGIPYGHTGTILQEGERASLEEMRAQLATRGMTLAVSLDEFYKHCLALSYA